MVQITSDAEVRLNAWTGVISPVGDPLSGPRGWGLRAAASGSAADLGFLRPAEPVDQRLWRHPEVGWGLVLPDVDGADPKSLAAGEDAPPALRRLLADRAGSPVLRWREDLNDGYLRRYAEDGTPADLSVAASKRGTGRNQVPRYLLIYAEPSEIPWRTQYILNMTAFTGRLALCDEALERYVDHLISDWAGAGADATAPLVWTVDHGRPDISWLMRGSLADPLWAKLSADSDLKHATRICAADATRTKLADTLAARKPGLVVTTSHGSTPVSSPDKLKSELGYLVDVEHQLADPETLLGGWSPDGAIWYSHACCSAGADAGTRYDGLFGASDPVGMLLRAVGGPGARIAPLPTALLSTPKPLRAWVGHVEPTFDWTLRDPNNTQVLTSNLVAALYDELYQPDTPIGFALREVFDEAGAFLALWQDALAKVNAGDTGAMPLAKYRQLVAMDRQSLVILGDPTVGLPAI